MVIYISVEVKIPILMTLRVRVLWNVFLIHTGAVIGAARTKERQGFCCFRMILEETSNTEPTVQPAHTGRQGLNFICAFSAKSRTRPLRVLFHASLRTPFSNTERQ